MRPRKAARSLKFWGRESPHGSSRIGANKKAPKRKASGPLNTNQTLMIRHFLKQVDVPAFLTLIALRGSRVTVHFACVPEWNCGDSQLFFAVNRLVTVSANERLHWRTLPSEKNEFKTGVGMLAAWQPGSEGNPEKNGIDRQSEGQKATRLTMRRRAASDHSSRARRRKIHSAVNSPAKSNSTSQ